MKRFFGVLGVLVGLSAAAQAENPKTAALTVRVDGLRNSRLFESPAPVAYRASWAKLLARVYDVDGHGCPECSGRFAEVGAVLVPAATQWILEQRMAPLLGTGSPGGPLCLPLAS